MSVCVDDALDALCELTGENASEAVINEVFKKFCVGKHSWHIIDSKKGAKASAILYSIAETAKANGLNPFEYFKFLMEQLKEYPRNDVPEEELKKLMPWSEMLPDCCKQLKKQS